MNPPAPLPPSTTTLAEANARVAQLEQALAERENVLREVTAQRDFYYSVVYEMPSDIAVFDGAHRYMFLNPEAIRNPEIRNWIVGKDDFEYCAYRGFSPERAMMRRAYFERAVAERRGVGWEEELPPITPGDGPRHFLRRFFPIYKPDGSLNFMLGYGLNITDRVLAEQAAMQAQQVAETSAKARTTFLANMSHEIRTPLNGVLGIAALLAKTPLLPDQQQQVAIIRSSGQHLLAVINDVLDVAKITSGKLEIEHAPFNVAESVALAVEPLAQQARQRGLEFQLENLTLEAPWVLGDAFRLNQILLNLLSNAIKFTPHGIVTLSSRQLAHTPETITVEFCVTDTGIGIPADKLEHIFESFTQAYADTTRQFGGTGLGLNISRSLVERLGGRLTVASRPGQGSAFAFQLVLPRAIAPGSEAEEPADDSLEGLCVLLVEDNDINRFVARRMVQSWGGLVDEAPDGFVALELFERNHYDVVLMDIQLPGMNGMEITQRMRQHTNPRKAGIAILALTANAYQSDMQQYLAAGMNDTLSKPFDEADLVRKLVALRPPPETDLEG